MRQAIDFTPVSVQEASKQWFSRPADERYESLETLATAVGSRRSRTRQYDIETTAITVTANGDEQEAGITVTSDRDSLLPSHWGFQQLASRAGAPAGYLRRLTPILAADCLNYGLKKLSTNDEAKFMTVDQDEEGAVVQLASVTSPTYGRIWDADVVAAVQEIVEKTGNVFFNPKEWSGRPSGLYASDHDVFMFLIDGGSIVDGGSERDQLHRGFFVSNSEVGAAELLIETFLHRGVCGNHTVWMPEQVRALRLRHTAKAPEKFVEAALPKLEEYAKLSVDSYQTMLLSAKSYKTPSDKDESAKFLVKQGFTPGEAKRAVAAAEREEGSFDSLWLLHCGLTATARDMAYIDARVNLEDRAGKLLNLAVA